jgi:tetratricopeptide (TPR) repeat protein
MQALLRSAWVNYRLRDFPLALKEFEKLRASTQPGSELNTWGLYGQACCWNYRQDARDIVKASELYNELLKASPNHPLAAWSSFDLVRLKHLAKADEVLDYPALIAQYGDVAKKYSGTAAGTEALLFRLNLQISLQQSDNLEILAEAEKYVQAYPKSPYTFRFYGMIAGCYKAMKRSDKYLEYNGKMLEVQEKDTANPNFENASTYWRLAYEAEFIVGDFDLARRYYELIRTEYPRDMRVFGAEEALKRMNDVEAAIREGRPIPAKWLSREAAATEPAPAPEVPATTPAAAPSPESPSTATPSTTTSAPEG